MRLLVLGEQGMLGHVVKLYFQKLGHDVRGRRAIGVAHAHVDDVFAPAAGGHLQFARDVEHVGRQALDAGKVLHGASGGSKSKILTPQGAWGEKV